MKIKVNVGGDKYKEIAGKLSAAGFIIDDEGEYVITENSCFASYIPVRNDNGERIQLPCDEIVFIESFGHSVVVHSSDKNSFNTTDRLYQLSSSLDSRKFLRVSNCAIISAAHVRKIRPTISTKFILTMSDGSLVDVTRSYYNIFREFFGI